MISLLSTTYDQVFLEGPLLLLAIHITTCVLNVRAKGSPALLKTTKRIGWTMAHVPRRCRACAGWPA